MEKFKVYENPREIFKQIFLDLSSAKKSVFLETYIYDDDEIGRKIVNILTKKAKEGLDVRLLVDAWGGNARKSFFDNLIKKGGKVRFFREIRYLVRFFSKNHERNHRKLLIIDNKITYIGSINITAECLNWRELVIRMEGDIAKSFVRSFHQSWEMYGNLTKKRIKTIVYRRYEILHDIPSYIERVTERRLYKLILKAKREILIETPYFVPSINLINNLGKAVKRKVKVKLLVPYKSDVRIVDIIRNKYLGMIYKRGIEIYYYNRKVLHSKLLLVDEDFFMLGSSNLDYRSFIHNYEINLVGKNKKLIRELRDFYYRGLKNSKPFNYDEWKNRSSVWRILELFFEKIKKYL